MALIQEIMAVLVAETPLLIALPGDRSWLFDPRGAVPDDEGNIDKGVVHIVAICHRLSH